jgi:thiol-disulfide isomerase/thioredoxin
LLTGLILRALLLASALSTSNTARLATDLDGHAIDRLASSGTRAVVLFFAASDCPLSNRYIPEIQRIAKEFAPDAVHVWFVYPNPGDSAKIVRSHNAEYAIDAPTALDTAQALTQMAHAAVTPEAAIFIPEGRELREVYRGRIDDRYIAFGRERPQAMHHDLEDAIRAVLDRRSVPQPGGPPIGCSIVTLHP